MTYKVESYYTAVVDASDFSIDDAECRADREFATEYFGDAYDVTGHIVKIEGEDDERSYVLYEE